MYFSHSCKNIMISFHKVTFVLTKVYITKQIYVKKKRCHTFCHIWKLIGEKDRINIEKDDKYADF